jgi:hypothetical protein
MHLNTLFEMQILESVMDDNTMELYLISIHLKLIYS